MTGLTGTSFTFDPRPNYPFLITAKRYLPPNPSNDPEALTLILAHGTGFHKESWEPGLCDLLFLLRDSNSGVNIREIWSIDAPNHGDAGVLNETALGWGYENVFGWEEYARGIHVFLSGLGTGVDTNFSTHNLVGIGHSMGAISLVLSTTFEPRVSYKSLQLVEPMLLAQGTEGVTGGMLLQGASKRRDVWPSRKEAYNLLKGRASFKVWDDRVLKSFVEYGLRPVPSLVYPDKTEGVTLKCTKAQEWATYNDLKARALAYNLLAHTLKSIPTHIIYGAVDDYVSGPVKEDVLYNASGGIDNFASVARVPGAGSAN